MNEIILKIDGNLKCKDRDFTRLLGGFGDNKPMFTLWQAGELLGLRTDKIVQNFENYSYNFDKNIDYIDLKLANPDKVSNKPIEITNFFKNVGYSIQKLNATKRWLVFSYSGMMKLVKIATTKESWNIYDNFLEDYFKTKAENITMKKSIKEELSFLKEQRATLLGKMFMEQDSNKKMDLFNQQESTNKRIISLEQSLTKENVIKQLKSDLDVANALTNSKNSYDIGVFAKSLYIPNLGRNNLFKWLKFNKILMNNNNPYQKYIDYFKVIQTVKNGFTNSKTLITPKGIKYIIKKLIQDGYKIGKSSEEILEDLESLEKKYHEYKKNNSR